MPYADKEEQSRWGREYYKKHQTYIKKRERRNYAKNHDAIRARRRELNTDERRAKASGNERRKYAEGRVQVIAHYGGNCACCGETEPMFMEIDHINNDGKEHRIAIGHSARALVNWLIKNDYPDGFQLLCSNCNQGKKRNGGICPHKKNTQ